MPFFFKTLIFDGCFGKYRLHLPFFDNIGNCLYILEYSLRTPPLGYCFLVFKYISIFRLCSIFIQQIQHKNNLVNAVFQADLFIRTNKDLNFFPIWALCRHTVGTWTFKQSRNLGNQATQDNWIFEALWH